MPPEERRRRGAKKRRTVPPATSARRRAAVEPAAAAIDAPTLAMAGALVLVSAALYVATTARDVVFGDTAEFLTVAFSGGVAHPPGYPLFTLLARTFSALPLEPLPFRVNLLSAVCHALAVGLVYVTAVRVSGSRGAALVAGAVLATTPLFWRWSLVAEVFPLSDVLAAAMLLLVVLWEERPARTWAFVGAALAGGLGLANHLTIGLLAPAILYVLWRRRGEFRARPAVLVAAAAAAAVGLLPYAYLPWAAAQQPAWNWGGISSAADFIDHVLRRHYGSGQLINVTEYAGGNPLDRVGQLLASFLPLEAPLAILGFVAAYRRLRRYFWFALLGVAFSGVAFAAYANANTSVALVQSVLERFFLLAHVAVAPVMALGARLVADLLTLERRIREPALAAAAAVITVAAVLVGYAGADQSRNHVARRYAEDLLASLEPNALFLVEGDDSSFTTSYLQIVEGRRPDVAIVLLSILNSEWYVRQLKRSRGDLVIPFRSYGGSEGTLKMLLDANAARPAAARADVSEEPSLVRAYFVYPRGLVLRFEKAGKEVPADTFAADNQRLFESFRPPPFAETRPTSWEREAVHSYAISAYFVGAEFSEDLRRPADARKWYERALALYPDLPEARDALAKLPR